MTVTPRVTVGVPVRNGANFLPGALDALRAQDHDDFEVVISDNGSTDATRQICEAAAAADSRIRYSRVDEDRGAAWNFNRVVELAAGHYFAWAAHDDLRTPDFLSRSVGVLDADPSVVLCYGRATEIDDTGTTLFEHPSFRYADQPNASARAGSVLRTPTPCFEVFGLMRRSDLRETAMIGPYTSSDRTLLFELALKGRFEEIPATLFRHRQHASRSVRQDKRDRDAWFDPSRADRLTFPTWKLVQGHVRAVRRSGLPPREQAEILGSVAVWSGRRSGALAREVAAWTRHRVVPQ